MRPSSEALLISALVNNHDARLGQGYGLLPEMFAGFQTEYRWVLSYQATYGNAPGKDALLTKFSDFPYTDHEDAAFAADEVRYNFNHRELRSALRSAAQAVAEGDYEDAAMAIAGYAPYTAIKPMTNALHDMTFLDSYHERPDALELPWKTLQAVTGGVRTGDLVYLAARLGQGKSWTAAEVVAHALQQGRNVAFYSLEMPKEQQKLRIVCCLGRRLGISVDHIGMRDRIYDVIAYRKLLGRIRDEIPGSLYLFDQADGRCSPATVSARANEVDLNVIDYAGLMASPLGRKAIDDWRTMAAISNELKEMAVAKSTRVLALAQINRDGDTNSKYPPKVKNLAQSDALGQDGDMVITHKKYARTAQIYSVEKNRNGTSGVYFFTRFLPNEAGFHEISQDSADNLRDREDVMS